jgi:pyruvate formate lyase activating enzyme
MKIKGIVPTSLSDWDGKISYVIFLPGCNFRCGFCHNKDLVLYPEKKESISFETIQNDLETAKKHKFVGGVVITGGEPTIYNDLPDLCKKIKDLGFPVKLDTNGSNPEMLEQLLEKNLLDYIAMDIKTSFKKYQKAVNFEIDVEKIKKSIDLVSRLPDYEFRMTYIPGVADHADLLEIAKYLKEKGANKKFFLQQFKSGECLDEKFDNVRPYSEVEFKNSLSLIEGYFEKCGLRNI